MPAKKNTEQDFWNKVDIKGPNDCWEWQGWRNKLQYGKGFYLSKGWAAHRLAYTFAKGPIPEGLFVMHSCDNPPCVNPAHLSVGTALDNMQDKINKGRHVANLTCGEDRVAAKLTEDDVRDIRSSSVSTRKLAEFYGVTAPAIYQARIGMTWKHVV